MAAFPGNDHELIQHARSASGAERRSWLLPWLLLALLGGLLLLEWSFSPVERALGNYMLYASEVRPRSGRSWELNRESAEAMRTLGRLSQTTRQRQVAGATLEGWEAIPSMLDSLDRFNISTQRFLDLYNLLPPALRQMVVDPVQILRLRSGGEWQRVYFKREGDDDIALMLDKYNVVLHRTALDPLFYRLYEEATRPRAATLEDLDRYETIIDADRFFATLAPNGPVQLSGEDIRWISGLEGRLERVGMAASASNGVWGFGFEVVREERYYVHSYWLAESLGAALRKELKKGESSRRGGRR